MTPLHVFLLSGDLLFASKVKSTVESMGGQFGMGGNLPTDGTQSISHLVLDLSTRRGLTDTVMGIREEKCTAAKVIAYGPHVQVDRLKNAREAGIEMVLTNGQFDAGMRTIFEAE